MKEEKEKITWKWDSLTVIIIIMMQFDLFCYMTFTTLAKYIMLVNFIGMAYLLYKKEVKQ